mmetsp:Transcript_431/g.776  ORF Transcript_431/g.776 Transcript_431/m.776 type:complete len:106 (+) Transcript_431:841-1158(+)
MATPMSMPMPIKAAAPESIPVPEKAATTSICLRNQRSHHDADCRSEASAAASTEAASAMPCQFQRYKILMTNCRRSKLSKKVNHCILLFILLRFMDKLIRLVSHF